MKDLNTAVLNDSKGANQNLYNAKKLIERYLYFQIHPYDSIYDIDLSSADIDKSDLKNDIAKKNYNFNPRESYAIKNFFGLLTDEEFANNPRRRYTEDDYPEDTVDYETLLQYSEATYKDSSDADSESDTLYEDIMVLRTYSYPCFQAYKIGKTIDEYQFIGDSTTWNGVREIIVNYLKTGECDLH